MSLRKDTELPFASPSLKLVATDAIQVVQSCRPTTETLESIPPLIQHSEFYKIASILKCL